MMISITVAVAQPANWPACQRLWPDVPDACPGRDARKARIGQQGHLLAPGDILERRGELVGLFHARAQRPAADVHQHIARLDGRLGLSFDGLDGSMLGGEHPRRPA